MLTVHHLEDSRSQRVLWLLEELHVPYQVQHHRRDPETMFAPPELKRVHPLGKSPVVVDADTVVAETGAIVEYLIDRHPGAGLRPAVGTPDHLRWRYWLHFAEGSAMPPLLVKLIFDRVRAAKMPFFARPIVNAVADKVQASYVGPNLERQFDFLEAELASRPWFAGEAFSAADIMMSFPVEVAASRAGLGPSRPKLKAWLDTIRARPAYHRALERGGPYAYGA